MPPNPADADFAFWVTSGSQQEFVARLLRPRKRTNNILRGGNWDSLGATRGARYETSMHLAAALPAVTGIAISGVGWSCSQVSSRSDRRIFRSYCLTS